MRLEFKLRQVNNAYIPFNRKYGLMTWLYGCISEEDEQYATELHSSKGFKDFVFSDLVIPYPYEVDPKRGVKKENDRDLSLLFSSPSQVLVKTLLKGVMPSAKTKEFRLGPAEFEVNRVHIKETPDFKREEIFLPLSPVVTSTWRDGKIWYLRPHEEKFLVNIKRNLEKKYTKLTGGIDTPTFELEPAYKYLRKGKVSYSIQFKNYRVVGFKIPFRMKGEVEVIKAAYECGLGERNSQGFGMVELH